MLQHAGACWDRHCAPALIEQSWDSCHSCTHILQMLSLSRLHVASPPDAHPVALDLAVGQVPAAKEQSQLLSWPPPICASPCDSTSQLGKLQFLSVCIFCSADGCNHRQPSVNACTSACIR